MVLWVLDDDNREHEVVGGKLLWTFTGRTLFGWLAGILAPVGFQFAKSLPELDAGGSDLLLKTPHFDEQLILDVPRVGRRFCLGERRSDRRGEKYKA
jgi:hypothetical protein